MNVLRQSPRVDIAISVNPEFELRLDHLSIQEPGPTRPDFSGNRIEIGHARFTILSEVGEISTGCLLLAEFTREDHTAAAAWHLVVVARPALEPLVEAMRELLMAEAGDRIRRRAELGWKSTEDDGRSERRS